jgi:predicted nucleic acid-binding protein
LILFDTSIWVDHFRRRDPRLAAMIVDEEVVCHPFVLGELLLGGLPANSEAGELLYELPVPHVASPGEAETFIIENRLSGTGIGYVDAHLLLSARLTYSGQVLTRDKHLHEQAERLGLAYVL